MDAIGDVLHSVGESRLVHPEVVVVTSAVGPAIIENHVIVANVSKSGAYEYFRCVQEQIFRYIATQSVPVVLHDCQQSPRQDLRAGRRRTQPICGVRARPLLTALANKMKEHTMTTRNERIVARSALTQRAVRMLRFNHDITNTSKGKLICYETIASARCDTQRSITGFETSRCRPHGEMLGEIVAPRQSHQDTSNIIR